MANVGLGLETAARRFGLGYVPLLNERYFFLCDEDMLDSLGVHRVIELISSALFCTTASRIPS